MFVEVRWHGRGGQGVVTASELLAGAALAEGKYLQAFPEFGPERMGAPIRAFTRISDEPIEIHSHVYTPDVVVVLDPTLLESPTITDGLSDEGKLIVNYAGTPEDVRKITKYMGRIYVVDATRIAMETIGRPIANTCCVGALVKVTDLVGLEEVENQIRKMLEFKIGKKATDANVHALNRAHKEVKS
ncbi:MAG: 2-oxoacid:acceptor oxidoreductase family protein [Theionarchaea archaeon]|nr:MAG: pyruvate synthase [Theionarchaea archaeon DG-70]MBU7009906.1 2-oxoacid:acceptor oxidoreductase family protein [Theionarchaea archaeon]